MISSTRLFPIAFLLCLLSLAPQLKASDSTVDSLKSTLNKMSEDSNRVHVLNDLAFRHSNHQPELCRQYAQEALQLSKKLRFSVGIVRSYQNLGLYHTVTNDYAQALTSYKKALEEALPLKDNILISKVYCDIGVAYQSTDAFNLALDSYLRSLEYNNKSEVKYQSGVIYGNLGNLYEEQNDYDKALEYYQKALDFFIIEGNQRLESLVYGNIGVLYHSLEEYHTAIDYFHQSIAIDSILNNQYSLSNNYSNLARTLRATHQYDEALMNYKTACDIDITINNLSGLAFDYAGISSIFYEISLDSIAENHSQNLQMADRGGKEMNLRASLRMGLKADSLFRSIGSPSYEVLEVLSNAYLELDEDSLALVYLNQYWSQRNEIFSTDKARDFARLEARGQNELNEAKIEALESQKENQKIIITLVSVVLILAIGLIIETFNRLRIRRRSNRELIKLNSQLKTAKEAREKFLAIVAHDLINPIGGMESAMRIYQKEEEHLSEEEKEEYVSALIESSSRAHGLLSNLLEWGKMQNGLMEFKPEWKNLPEVVHTSVKLLENNAKLKNITINFSMEDCSTHNGDIDEYMMSSVISNLVSNAIKFTPEGGEIFIGCELINETLKLTIKDSGIGMKEEHRSSLFDLGKHVTSLGTNRERGSGLGLILCKEFIDAHKGSIDVYSVKGKGSKFVVSIPQNQK